MPNTTIINNTEYDNNAYESLHMQSEIMDEIVSYADTVYGETSLERIANGDVDFMNRVCNEYWDSVLI